MLGNPADSGSMITLQFSLSVVAGHLDIADAALCAGVIDSALPVVGSTAQLLVGQNRAGCHIDTQSRHAQTPRDRIFMPKGQRLQSELIARQMFRDAARIDESGG